MLQPAIPTHLPPHKVNYRVQRYTAHFLWLQDVQKETYSKQKNNSLVPTYRITIRETDTFSVVLKRNY